MRNSRIFVIAQVSVALSNRLAKGVSAISGTYRLYSPSRQPFSACYGTVARSAYPRAAYVAAPSAHCITCHSANLVAWNH
jgi:hypothetical protein